MAARKAPIRKKAEGSYHHGDLKVSLKRAALRLVREKGPRGFSLNEASRLAGVSVAAPYRHFKDKDALLAELACDGNQLLAAEVQESLNRVQDVRKQMVEAGLAYLHFAQQHADYFAVMFGAGLEKSRYPEVERTGKDAFHLLLALAQNMEEDAERAAEKALAAWALVHGLATLAADGALAVVAAGSPVQEHLRPLLHRYVQDTFPQAISRRASR